MSDLRGCHYRARRQVVICSNPQLVTWTPDFSSSGQRSPQWTEVRCHGEQLTNALNWVQWDDAPVQVVLCEECGVDGCAVGGYVHVSRHDDDVLWTAPHIDAEDEFEAHQYTASEVVLRHGAVVIPVATWEAWRHRFANVPPASVLPLAQERDVRAAWY